MGTVAKLSLLGALFALSACSGSSSPATAAASKLPPGSGGDDAGEVQGSDAGGTVTPPTGDDAGSPAADAGGGEDAATGSDAGEDAGVDAGTPIDAGHSPGHDAGQDAASLGCWVAGCPSGQECNNETDVCESSCSVHAPCTTGCCNPDGTCSSGTVATACGPGDGTGGGLCVDCTASAQLCLPSTGGGTCGGCVNSTACGANEACDTKTHTCTTACPADLCNGGCCNNGECVVGTDPTACGNDGHACGSCAGGLTGVCTAGQLTCH